MKIAIASDDGKIIAAHFGRTRGFVLYEIENEKILNRSYRPNDFTGHARDLNHAGHEANRHGPVLRALKDCQVIISRGMGRRMYDDLQSAGIQTFIVEETETDRALELYLQNGLTDHPDKGCAH